jgi:hypothetical protein
MNLALRSCASLMLMFGAAYAENFGGLNTFGITGGGQGCGSCEHSTFGTSSEGEATGDGSGCCGEAFTNAKRDIPEFALAESQETYAKIMNADDARIAALLASGESICEALKCNFMSDKVALEVVKAARDDKAKIEDRNTNYIIAAIAAVVALLVGVPGFLASVRSRRSTVAH